MVREPLNLPAPKTYDVIIPQLNRLDWSIRRYIILKIRFYKQTAIERLPILIQKLMMLFGEDPGLGGEEPFFWVPDYKTIHMGPCMLCLDLEARFRKHGGKLSVLQAEMDKPHFREAHAGSNLGPGVTYSKILTMEKANNPAFGGIGTYGDFVSPDKKDGDWFTAWHEEQVRNIYMNHRAQNKDIAAVKAITRLNIEARQRQVEGADVSGIEALPGGMA